MAQPTRYDSNELWSHRCANCNAFIRDVRFVCTQCVNLELCLQCYICKVELGEHEPTHGVNIIDLATFPLFENFSQCGESEMKTESTESTPRKQQARPRKRAKKEPDSRVFQYQLHIDEKLKLCTKITGTTSTDESDCSWRACDELKLLEAIERAGFGNWEGARKELTQDRLRGVSAEEMMQHYIVHYLLTDVGPQTTLWRSDTKRLKDIFDSYSKIPEYQRLHEVFEGVTQEDLDELHYSPKRDEFTIEFCNSAEDQIMKSILTFPQIDGSLEEKFVLAHIGLYHQVLRQRLNLKNIVASYGLLGKFFQRDKSSSSTPRAANKRYSKSPGKQQSIVKFIKESSMDLQSVILPFLRFLNTEQLRHLNDGLKREYLLKVLIRKLLQYKRHGLTTLKQVQQFEDHRKAQRERRRKNKKAVADESSDDDEAFPFNVDYLKNLFPLTLQDEDTEALVAKALGESNEEPMDEEAS